MEAREFEADFGPATMAVDAFGQPLVGADSLDAAPGAHIAPGCASSESVVAQAPSPPARTVPGWWREREILLLSVILLLVYSARLQALPICGEESRWANGAIEMLSTGDWIVPRQQHAIFPERPPLGSWTMALTALVVGEMNAVAVRFPSVLATVLTSIIIYGYGRTFLSRFGALAAAAVYGSFGQVLQLGQLGESEALFTCLLAGSLLVWHWGYACGWPAIAMWTTGYALAALAALDKGLQAPVYFVAVTSIFLLWRGELRRVFSWANAAGVATFLLIVGLWQVPFCLATDWQATRDIWSGLAADRIKWEGLAMHVLSYPWETLGCLLPWSPMLAAYLAPRFWRSARDCRPQIFFLITAVGVTYPTLLMSAGARGRYFMPLYPCLAILIGVVIDRWESGHAGSPERFAWRCMLRAISGVALGCGVVLGLAPLMGFEKLEDLRQPAWFGIGYFLVAAVVALVMWVHTAEPGDRQRFPALDHWRRRLNGLSPQAAMLTLVALLGLTQTGVLHNLRLNKANDLQPIAAKLHATFPPGFKLVSLGPIAHRFAYFYGEPIREVRWPSYADETPENLTYFCFDLHAGDNVWFRNDGRGRQWTKTLGILPFTWEPVMVIPCDPQRKQNADTTVIVGRVTGSLYPPVTTHDNLAGRGPARSIGATAR
jgi:4-amino-4-deoxy-L-arabinose transferase-like glycosyltransferase